MNTAAEILTFASAFFGLVVAGVYLGFDLMVMPALRSRPAADAVQTMQAINRQALRPAFMVLFFGSALSAVAATVVELLAVDPASTATRLIGNLLVFASFVITVVVNVPRNNAVADLDPHSPHTAERWLPIATGWFWGNRWRLATSMVGAAVLFSTLLAPAPA